MTRKKLVYLLSNVTSIRKKNIITKENTQKFESA